MFCTGREYLKSMPLYQEKLLSSARGMFQRIYELMEFIVSLTKTMSLLLICRAAERLRGAHAPMTT
jgi:hypothetical protein